MWCSTIGDVTLANIILQAGTENHTGVREKTNSLPARDLCKGSPKLKRWRRVHDYEVVNDEMLDDVDMQDAQLCQNESISKKNIPSVVVSDQSSSKRYYNVHTCM